MWPKKEILTTKKNGAGVGGGGGNGMSSCADPEEFWKGVQKPSGTFHAGINWHRQV